MMKKSVFILFILAIVSTVSIAQEDAPKEKPKKVKPLREKFKREDLMMMNFNWNTLLQHADSVKMNAASWGYDLKFMYEMPIEKSQISFGIGVGLGINKFYSDAEVKTKVTVIDSVTVQNLDYFQPISDSRSYKRNQFVTTYLDIPAEFRWRSKTDSKGFKWKVAVGGKIGRHLQSHSKIIENGVKYKTFDYPNYKKWRYGFNLRVGYGKVGINAFYSATSLFEDKKGEKVYPLTIGFTLMPF